MKKYYIVKMVHKNQTNDEEFILVGRYVISNEEELKILSEKLAASQERESNDFDIHFEETNLTEFISYEEDELRRIISQKYLNRHKEKYSFLPAKEYLNTLQHIEDELYWEILSEENKLLRIDKIIRRKINFNKITLKQYDDLRHALLDAKDSQEFDDLLQKYEAN